MTADGKTIADTTRRHWRILQLVPRAPRKIDAATICTRLAAEGLTVTQRSVQRDLEALANAFGLVCDTRSKPFGWWWSADATGFEFPPMSLPAAVAFEVVSENVRPLLPPAVVEAMQPTFDRARATREAAQRAPLAGWPDKVRSVPPGLVRVPTRVHRDVFEGTCTALDTGRRLQIGYTARGASVERVHEVSPIAPREEPSTLALQRMSHAKVLDVPAIVIPGFDLDAYIAGGALSGRKSDVPVKLKIRVTKRVADLIEEAPLSADQVVRRGTDGGAEIEATVADTLELRAWVLGFGAELVVLGPPALVAEVTAKVEGMARAYRELASG